MQVWMRAFSLGLLGMTVAVGRKHGIGSSFSGAIFEFGSGPKRVVPRVLSV